MHQILVCLTFPLVNTLHSAQSHWMQQKENKSNDAVCQKMLTKLSFVSRNVRRKEQERKTPKRKHAVHPGVDKQIELHHLKAAKGDNCAFCAMLLWHEPRKGWTNTLRWSTADIDTFNMLLLLWFFWNLTPQRNQRHWYVLSNYIAAACVDELKLCGVTAQGIWVCPLKHHQTMQFI